MNWFWHALWIAFVVIPLTLLWAFSLMDIFVRRDLSGWARFGWVFAVLVLPLLGPLTYLAVRPQAEDVVDLREPSGTPTGTRTGTRTGTPEMLIADEVIKLDRLRSAGVITNEEFAAQKARLLAVPTQRDPAPGTARRDSRL
ncbi:MAG TPA: SHOCT domain-containing protein [Frankiaceae bacterium]|nr:SHOCT domain-containing protein [Frankiaceae bacterium]